MDDQIVEFEGRERALRDTVPAALQADYREAVVKFRYWLREKGKEATVAAFKQHLAWKKSFCQPSSTKFVCRRCGGTGTRGRSEEFRSQASAVRRGEAGRTGRKVNDGSESD